MSSGLHCWAAGPWTEDGMSTTCMRERGHIGEHAWTRDDRITIALPAHAPDPRDGEEEGAGE